MKVLFVCCYVNNSHYIKYTKKYLDKYLINTSYDYICLNDAPDVKNGDENYLEICNMLTGEDNCYKLILNEAKKHNFIHIKIPQDIHIKNRLNHGGPRHIENFNYFNINIDKLYPSYNEYDYLCYIDSDCFLRKYCDLNIELNGFDIITPMIYIKNNLKYPHTGLLFINLKTVVNFKDIKWDNTLYTDTGSSIALWLQTNKQYNIKEIGSYDGYSTNNLIPNNHTILKLDIPEFNNTDKDYQLIDAWMDQKFYHFRGGSCFGIGSNIHREKRNFIKKYNLKLKVFMSHFE